MLFRSRDKAKNFCDARVQPCQRMWVADVAYFAQARTLADRNHAGATCPVLIHGDDEGALVAGKKKSARGMTKMVLDSGDCFVAGLMAQQAEVTKFSRQASNFAHLGVTCRYGIERRNSCTSRGAPHPSSDWSACDCDESTLFMSAATFDRQNFIAAVGNPRESLWRESLLSSMTARITPSSTRAAEVSCPNDDSPSMRMVIWNERMSRG